MNSGTHLQILKIDVAISWWNMMKPFLGPCLETFFWRCNQHRNKKTQSQDLRSEASRSWKRGTPSSVSRCGESRCEFFLFFVLVKTLIKIVTNCLLPVIWQDDWTWLLMSILEFPGFMYFGWVVYDYLFINIIIVMSLSLSSLLSLLWLYIRIYCYIYYSTCHDCARP